MTLFRLISWVFFTFFIQCVSGFAQITDFVKMDWGKIPLEDLQMDRYPADTTATALVLGDEGYMNILIFIDGNYQSVLNRHKRIKILTKAGLEECTDIAIPYVHIGSREYVHKIMAQTIHPDGTIIPLKKEDIFRERINKSWSKVIFAFPDAKAGSVIEYSYELLSKEVFSPTPWAFRGALPIRSSFFHFDSKAPISYTYLLQGAEYMKIEKQESYLESFSIDDTRIDIDRGKFWLQNGRAIQKEPYMTALEDYYLNLRFQASSIINTSGRITPINDTWKETAEKLLKDENLGQNFTQKKNYKKLLRAAKAVIDKRLPEEELLYAINRFITKEISWSGEYGIWGANSPNQSYELHEGSVAEIQYAALAILREFGFSAHPVLLSTRDNGAMIKTFPYIAQFNYVVVSVEMDGTPCFADFTEPMLKPGLIREGALNGAGFLLQKNHPSWIPLSIPMVKDVFVWDAIITEKGAIEGEMEATMSSLSALQERKQLQGFTIEKAWSNRLSNGGTWSKLDTLNTANIRKDLIIQGTFEVPNAGFLNGDYLYITPITYTNFSENPFLREQRDYPVNFPYSFEEKSIYQYQIPAGYIVEYAPEDMSAMLPNKDLVFQYLVHHKDRVINIESIIRVNKQDYTPQEYPALRDLFDQMAQKMQEQIVLRKI